MKWVCFAEGDKEKYHNISTLLNSSWMMNTYAYKEQLGDCSNQSQLVQKYDEPIRIWFDYMYEKHAASMEKHEGDCVFGVNRRARTLQWENLLWEETENWIGVNYLDTEIAGVYFSLPSRIWIRLDDWTHNTILITGVTMNFQQNTIIMLKRAFLSNTH